MFLRGAALASATIGTAAFAAGLAAGAGLAVAAVGTAYLARRAMKRRGDWGRAPEPVSAEAEPAMPDEGEPSPA